MDNLEIAKKTKRISTFLVVSAIIGLCCMMTLPLIEISEVTPSGEVKTVFTLGKMENSYDSQITPILEDVEEVNIYFWLVILSGTVSFIGITWYITSKNSFVPIVIMILGCASLVFSVLAVFFLWSWIDNIEDMQTVSTVMLGDLSVKYVYLPLTMGGISLLGSLFYTRVVVPFSIHRLADTLTQRQESLETEHTIQPSIEDRRQERAKKMSAGISAEDIHQTWTTPRPPNLGANSQKRDDAVTDLGIETRDQLKMKVRSHLVTIPDGEKHDQIVSEETQRPFPNGKTLEKKSERAKEIVTSPLLEQALSSAIGKRQDKPDTEITLQDSPEVKKEMKVRCPQCAKIFSVEKGKDVIRIECPSCGKKGIVKE